MDEPTIGVSKFELAADAIVTGDAHTLVALLQETPGLVQARSSRAHRATLLHYLGANGIEDERQRSPKNAVEIGTILLAAGAEVDAIAEMYGNDTTLGLVATSIHPLQAGVQIPLLQLLLQHGADIDGAPGSRSILIAALHNGRSEAAEFLARRGARLDLESAAGVGRLDVVNSFFSNNGRLQGGATQAQLEYGFMWACEYGRNDVIEFLLQKGMDVNAQDPTGQSGLHWAAIGGQLKTVKLLLERGASLETVNGYGGTPLGQAMWCESNGNPALDYRSVIEILRASEATTAG